MSSISKKNGRPTVNRRVLVVPIRHETPDVRRLARALVNLAYAQYMNASTDASDSFDTDVEHSEMGEGTHAEP